MMKKRVFLCCLTVCVLIVSLPGLLSSCGFFDPDDPPAVINPEIGKRGGLYIDGELTDYMEPEYESEAYKGFDDMQKKLYCSAYTALSGMHNEFRITGVYFDRYFDEYAYVLTALYYDHPEFFWFNGYVEVQADYMEGSELGNITFILGVYDYWADRDVAAAANELDAKIDSIVAEMGKLQLEDDYTRVKYIHDLLINSVQYDYESYYKDGEINAKTDAFINSAYGPLMSGDALCGGYAHAFSLLMHELGIECEFVSGTADGGAHAWNMINLGGEYYHIDLTWDDYDGAPCNLAYTYFCVTDTDISKTHTLAPEFAYLSANATEYNYYLREGLYLEEYSFEAVNKMLKDREFGDSISFKCANDAVMDLSIESLIDNTKVYDLDIMQNNEVYQYIADEEHYIITFLIG